jgi:hypothetical protein
MKVCETALSSPSPPQQADPLCGRTKEAPAHLAFFSMVGEDASQLYQTPIARSPLRNTSATARVHSPWFWAMSQTVKAKAEIGAYAYMGRLWPQGLRVFAKARRTV